MPIGGPALLLFALVRELAERALIALVDLGEQALVRRDLRHRSTLRSAVGRGWQGRGGRARFNLASHERVLSAPESN